jgi:hypothetical protein
MLSSQEREETKFNKVRITLALLVPQRPDIFKKGIWISVYANASPLGDPLF